MIAGPKVVNAIRRGLKPEVSALDLIAARATRDESYADLYYVSTELRGAGLQQVDEVATWVLSSLDGSGSIRSLNQSALRLTTWPRALVVNEPINADTSAAQASERCAIKATSSPVTLPGLTGVLAWAGWIFAFFTGVTTVLAYIDQRKTLPALKYWLRKPQSELTDNELKAKEARLAEVSRQVNDIPRVARRAALETQLEALAVSLGDLHRRYQQVEERIRQPGSIPHLDQGLLYAIQKEIAPYYAERRRLQTYLYILLILVVGALFYPSVADFLLRWLYSSTTLPVSSRDLTAYTGGMVIASMVTFATPKRWWRELGRRLRWTSLLVSAALLGGWVLFLYSFVFYFGSTMSPDLQNFLAVLSLAPFAVGTRLLTVYYQELRSALLRKGVVP
jgi:hypothetical protein